MLTVSLFTGINVMVVVSVGHPAFFPKYERSSR